MAKVSEYLLGMWAETCVRMANEYERSYERLRELHDEAGDGPTVGPLRSAVNAVWSNGHFLVIAAQHLHECTVDTDYRNVPRDLHDKIREYVKTLRNVLEHLNEGSFDGTRVTADKDNSTRKRWSLDKLPNGSLSLWITVDADEYIVFDLITPEEIRDWAQDVLDRVND